MIDIFEIEELIEQIYEDQNGEVPDPIDFNFDEYIYNLYGCNCQQYCDIVEDLINYTPVVSSPLTGQLSHCFGVVINPEKGLFKAIVKKDIKNN